MILGRSEATAFSWATSLFVAAAFHTLATVSFSFHDEFKPALSSSATEPRLPSDSNPFLPAVFEKDKIYNRGEPIIIL